MALSIASAPKYPKIPPITRPSDSGEVLYKWNEDLYQSDNTKGWVEND